MKIEKYGDFSEESDIKLKYLKRFKQGWGIETFAETSSLEKIRKKLDQGKPKYRKLVVDPTKKKGANPIWEVYDGKKYYYEVGENPLGYSSQKYMFVSKSKITNPYRMFKTYQAIAYNDLTGQKFDWETGVKFTFDEVNARTLKKKVERWKRNEKGGY